VKISWTKMVLILDKLWGLIGIFIPRVEQTKSQTAESWFEWKWIAINNSISPKEAFTPLALMEKIYQSF
jgi:hypothetical protein